MKRWAIIYFTLILLSPAPLFSALPPVQTSASDLQPLEKAIAQSQLSLEESMAELSRIFGIKIEMSGKYGNAPGKFNLNLEQATLEHAVKEAIRKAGVQSHALVWDQPNKTLRLLIFETGKNGSLTNQNATVSDLYKEDMNPLTQEQLYLLAQQNPDLQNEDQQPLTPEQLQQLQQQSAKIEAEEQESRKPLTPEQLQQLQKQSDKIEAEEQESSKPLTADQMLQLEKQTSENEALQPETDLKSLSKEKMLLLQESKAQDSPPLLEDSNKNRPQTDFPENHLQ